MRTAIRPKSQLHYVVVPGYGSVDRALVRDILDHRLDDLLAFCEIMRGRVVLDGHLCASTLLVVSALASPDWTVEIEAVAVG